MGFKVLYNFVLPLVQQFRVLQDDIKRRTCKSNDEIIADLSKLWLGRPSRLHAVIILSVPEPHCSI